MAQLGKNSKGHKVDEATAVAAIQDYTLSQKETAGTYQAALDKYNAESIEEVQVALTANLKKASESYMYTLANANALNADSSMIYPDTNMVRLVHVLQVLLVL